jgi:hypothetical protein
LVLFHKYFRTIIQLIVFIFSFENSFSQNLIRNGSFENISPPANWINWSGEFVTASQNPMHRVLFDWDEFHSSDLLTSSCTHTWSGVPINIHGYCQPKNGNNYVGFMLFSNGQNNNGKEYIYQQLTTALQSGKIYCLSFYVSRADRKEYAIENIGAYFSNNIQTTGSIGYINKIPQVVNQNGLIIDTTQWTQIQGCFTANGGEQFITIGNFNTDANTNSFYAGTNNPVPNYPEYCYYYIDDITLIDQTTVDLNELDKKNEFEVYPNPVTSVLNISAKQNQYNNTIIEITDYLGQTVYVKQFSNQIDLSDFTSGIYFLTLHDNFSNKRAKIIKQ